MRAGAKKSPRKSMRAARPAPPEEEDDWPATGDVKVLREFYSEIPRDVPAPSGYIVDHDWARRQRNQDRRERVMRATPEERQKMIEDGELDPLYYEEDWYHDSPV